MKFLELFPLLTHQESLALYACFSPVGMEEVELAGAASRW